MLLQINHGTKDQEQSMPSIQFRGLQRGRLMKPTKKKSDQDEGQV